MNHLLLIQQLRGFAYNARAGMFTSDQLADILDQLADQLTATPADRPSRIGNTSVSGAFTGHGPDLAPVLDCSCPSCREARATITGGVVAAHAACAEG